MNKDNKVRNSICMGLVVILSAMLLAGCGQASGNSRFLRVENGKIVNEKGKEVVLKGVNLGGWLIQESWMCPVSGNDREWANLDTVELLESRFSEEQVQNLFNTYQDNWITENDIKKISEMGCNVIRVPFWYRNFMKDEQGTWIDENLDENPGFKKLDWVIAQAEKYDMYVILDMHGCPGGQSMDHCCGTLCQNRLYTDEVCQRTMEKLWVAIASRYQGNATVAAYDIMNEPQNNGGYVGENSYDPWQSESWELSNAIYDKMITAIRAVDSEHIITVEGIWRLSNLPKPQDMGWTNMMYQLHLYDNEDDFRVWAEDLAEKAKEYGVAAYIGEFQNLLGLAICDENNISWTTWTYKGTKDNKGTFFWFFGETEQADCASDSYEELLEKWGSPIRTENFEENSLVTKLIAKSLQGKK